MNWKSYSWLGRRKLILFTSPLVAVGWCIIGMAQNRAMLFVGRALASAAIHSYSSSVGVYISETGWYEFADLKLLTKGIIFWNWYFDLSLTMTYLRFYFLGQLIWILWPKTSSLTKRILSFEIDISSSDHDLSFK